MCDGMLAVKKNETMPSAALWMDPEIIILEANHKIPHDITYMWDLKYDMSELVYKGQIDSHREQTGGCQGRGRRGEGRAGNWGSADANYSHRAGEQQGPTVEHRAPYSISCNKP